MTGLLLSLLLQTVGGAIGGNAILKVQKDIVLGPKGATIAGALGGLFGGSALSAIIPALLGGADVGIAALAGQLVGGGAMGAIVTAAVGFGMKFLKKG